VKNQTLYFTPSEEKGREERKKEKRKRKKSEKFLVINFGELLQVGLLGIFLLSLVYVNSS
jgi:hypothetical protein